MTDITRILSTIDAGDMEAADQLLPLVDAELRKRVAHKFAREKRCPGRLPAAVGNLPVSKERLFPGPGNTGKVLRVPGIRPPDLSLPGDDALATRSHRRTPT